MTVRELPIVRDILNVERTRRLTIGIVESGPNRWRVVRLSSLRWDGREWKRVGYTDLDPRWFDELMTGLESAYDAVSTRGAA